MKIIFNFILICLSLMFVSCDDSFNPKAKYSEEYALNCIIRVDTTFQIAMVSKSYDVNEYDPYQNKIDPNIEGAIIRIWYQDTVFIMKDTLKERVDTSHYNTPVKYYCVDGLQPDNSSLLEIEAILPNGKRLKSTTKTPDRFRFQSGEEGITIPPVNSDMVQINWTTTSERLMYLPKLTLLWYKKYEATRKIRITEVPIQYLQRGDSYEKVFPVADNINGISYPMENINRIMNEISEGDENKDVYTIIAARAEVIAMDNNLSGYYASTSVGGSNLSVRLDEADYSNIEGGLGIFGSYIKSSSVIFLSDDYVRSFGYKPEF